MATITDVVSALVEKTKNKEIKWDVFHYSNEGVPGGWAATYGDVRFSLINNPTELSVSSPSLTKLTHIGSGNEVLGLLDVVSTMYGSRGTTPDDAIEVAFSRLSRKA